MEKVDKYEYNLKLEEIDKLVDQGDYEEAAKLADTIDWRKVRNVRTLCLISEIYEAAGRLDRSKEMLERAYNRSSVGRTVLYRLVEVTTALGQYDEALEYYSEYVQAAPHDNNRYILKYMIYKGRGSSPQELIPILEEYLGQEYTERWAYELASVYQQAGQIQKCMAACDDLVLWFHTGKYVKKALELKKRYAVLTPKQQHIYEVCLQEEAQSDYFEDSDEETTLAQPSTEADDEVLAENIIAQTEKEIAGEIAARKAKKEKGKTAAAQTRQGSVSSAPSGVDEQDTRTSATDRRGSSDDRRTRMAGTDQTGSSDGRGTRMVATDRAGSSDSRGTRMTGSDRTGASDGRGTRMAGSDRAGSSDGRDARMMSRSQADAGAVPYGEPEASESAEYEELQVELARSVRKVISGVARKPEMNEDDVPAAVEERLRPVQEVSRHKEPEPAVGKLSIDDILLSMGEKGRQAAAAARAEREAAAAQEPEPADESTVASGQEPEPADESTVASGQELEPADESTVASGQKPEAEGVRTMASGQEPEADEGRTMATARESEAADVRTVASAQEPAGAETVAAAQEPAGAETVAAAQKPAEAGTVAAAQKTGAAGARTEAAAQETDAAGTRTEAAAYEPNVADGKTAVAAQGRDAADGGTAAFQEREGVSVPSTPARTMTAAAAEELTEEQLEALRYSSNPEKLMRNRGALPAYAQDRDLGATRRIVNPKEDLLEAARKEMMASKTIRLPAEEVSRAYAYRGEGQPDDAPEVNAIRRETASSAEETEEDHAGNAASHGQGAGGAGSQGSQASPEGISRGQSESTARSERSQAFTEGTVPEQGAGAAAGMRSQAQGAASAARDEQGWWASSDEDASGMEQSLAEVPENPNGAEEEYEEYYDDPLTIEPHLRGLFKGFTEIDGLEDQIANAILQVMAKGTDRTSRTGNLLIFGAHGSGKTTLATNLARAIAQEKGQKTAKMAKIYAADLNRRDIAATIAKIASGILIVEEAGDLADNTVEQMTTAMEFRTDGLVVILEDEQRYVHDLLMKHPRFTMKFTAQIYLPVYTVDELKMFAGRHAKELDYAISEDGYETIAQKIAAAATGDSPMSVTDVVELVDKAIRHSNKFVRKMSMGKKRYDENDYVVLFAKDFK